MALPTKLIPVAFYIKLSHQEQAQPLHSIQKYITYTGKLLNGTTFDMQPNASQTGWNLYSPIQGWQIAIPLIKKGGEIKMVIPSALAYGCIGSGPIPPQCAAIF